MCSNLEIEHEIGRGGSEADGLEANGVGALDDAAVPTFGELEAAGSVGSAAAFDSSHELSWTGALPSNGGL